MLQKAIIEKKLDKYSMKVRIPVYNKVKSDPTATPTNELYTATIQTLPGCSPNYQEGDVVIVDFENDDLSFPIIIGLLYRKHMPQGSTDITADSLVVNVNTNLSENTLIGEVTPDSLKKLNDKYSNNVKAISIQYSLSNYQDHYDSFSNWSEQAPQYWPGKFMWQRTTVTYEDGTIMRSMTCIQGAQGSAGSGATIEKTYVKYAISSNGTTPPDITQSGIWFPNPPKTTDVNPYLWSWTYTRFSDGKTNSAFGVSRVGTNSAIVYLYKRSTNEITAIDWTENLTYDFDNKKLTAAPARWSEEIPSGSEPLYVTAATASSITAQATIPPAEWSVPTLFSTSGLNSKTVLLYKRYGSSPATPSTAVTYTFSTGAIQPAAPDGWSLTIPTTEGNPCYVTQATAIGYGETYTIQKNAWSAPTVLAKDGNSDYIDQPVVDWYIVTNNTNTPTSPTADIEVETEWTGLGWTQDMSSLELSASNKYLWNAEVTHYTISGYIKTSPHIITTFAETGKGIQDIEDKFALNNDPENPPAKGSAVWGDNPITPTAQNKYLWKYEIIRYTTGDSKETTPTVISMYSAPGEEGAPGLSAAAVFLYQRATSASSITKPTGTLTYTFATGTLSGQLGDWKQSIPASNGNPCFVIQATAIGTGETDTISPSEWSTITELVSDGKNGTDGKDGTDGRNSAILYLYKRAESATIDWTNDLIYNFDTKSITNVPKGWYEEIPSGTAPIFVTAATASSNTSNDSIPSSEWATPVILAQNGQNGQDGAPGTDGVSITAVVNYYLATNLSADVTRQTEGWTTDIQTISPEKPYLWNYEEVKYSNTLSTYTDPCIIGTYGTQGEQGSAGVGITSIVEYYALSTTTTRPTTGWSTNLPSMDATNRYLWNYSVITYTNGDTSGSVTDALIIGVYGDSVLSVEIQADNGTLFNAKATSTTLSADVYLGVKQLTVRATGVVKDGATTMGQLNWFAKERFTGNGTSTTFDLGLDILNATTIPKVEITINGTTTTEFTVVDKDTIKFNTAPANESIILIQYLTSTSDKVTVTRTDVRGQVVIICKVVSSSKTLALSEVTIKDLNDASSLKSWYMLTVDNVTSVSAPSVVYDENDSSVVPTGEYKHKVGDTEEVTVSFTWQDSAPVVNSNTVSKLCYTFQMIIFSDNSCTAGTAERSAAFDAGVVSWLQAQEAKDAADNAQSSADNAQNTANDALDGTHQNAENIQHVQQTLTAIDGVLAAKLDTVTFTPYKENIDSFMQFDVEHSTMTLGKGNFKQQMSPTKNSFMEGSTEVAYISNQELYINNATVNNKLSLDEQWVITFDSSNGLIIKHI